MDMSETRIFHCKQYDLQCRAKPMDGGKYAPALVVVKQVWPTRPREIAVSRGSFSTPQDAIAAAYAQGVEWIQDYG